MKGALVDLCVVRERLAEIGRFTSTWKEVAVVVVKDEDVAQTQLCDLHLIARGKKKE